MTSAKLALKVLDLYALGVPKKTIAQQLNLHRNTVARIITRPERYKGN